jgi:hypothetical protein
MNAHRFPFALALLSLTVAASASARNVSLDVPAVFAIDAVTNAPAPVLRSAFFLRDIQLDGFGSPGTAAGLRRQLQRHFDVVLAGLAANFDRSLDVAVDRLQRARGESWSAAQRNAWRHTLAQRRLVNMRRLRLYQLRGVFPQNEHVADRAVPVFVDNYDTACAVGHLMRESGWTDAVAAIQRANNFVYVTDVRDGPLVDWVLVSGLTREEAALIQPGYYTIFRVFDPGLDALATGGEISQNGLVFSNFQFIAGAIANPETFPAEPPPINQYDLANFVARSGEGVLRTGGRSYDTVYDNWFALGLRDLDLFFPGIYSPEGPSGVIFAFDISLVDPDARVVGISIDSLLGNWITFHTGQINIRSAVYSASPGAQSELATLIADSGAPTPGFPHFLKQVSTTFAPQAKLKVVTSVRLQGDAAFTSIFQSFQVVPEPTANALGTLGGALALAFFRRRKRALRLVTGRS